MPRPGHSAPDGEERHGAGHRQAQDDGQPAGPLRPCRHATANGNPEALVSPWIGRFPLV